MAHIARHDFAANLLYELLYLPISFHPAAMWIHREIDRTREMACDEPVTARLLDPRAYAQSIMSIANGMCASASPGCSLGIFDGNILEQRIRRLMEGRSGGLGRGARRSGRQPGGPGGLRRNGFQPESFGAGAERALRRTRVGLCRL